MMTETEYEATQRVKAERAAKAAELAEGAEPCPSCGRSPHGMVQPYTVKNRVREGVEIGCLVCPNHRAFGTSRAEAIEAWNATDFIPAKPTEP
jgi:hypothetical protein